MRNHKYILFLVVILMTIGLISCNSPNEEVETKDSVTSTDENLGSEQETQEQDDVFAYRTNLNVEFTDFDFGGKAFNVLANEAYPRDIAVEDMTGETINDAVYARNQQINERYNTEIKYIPGAWDAIPDLFSAAVIAGDKSYDLLSNHAIGSGRLVVEGVMMNLYNVSSIDFSYPWWSESILKSFSYHNTAFLAPAELCLSVTEASQCIFFNSAKTEDYGLIDLYDSVRAGTWTIDALIDTSSSIYVDNDGNGTADDTDFYGLGTKSGHAMFWWYAFGETFVNITEDGIEPVLYNEKVVGFFEKISRYYNEQGVHCFMGGGSVVPEFANGNRLFVIGGFDDIENYLRDMDSDYGVLPLPKYDEQQKSYLTIAGGAHSVIGISKAADDPIAVGLIVENLNYLSYKDITPLYCDTVLKSKYARDNSSMEMIDIVLNGRVFDFGYLMDNWKGFAFVPQNMIQNGSLELASTYAAKIDAARTWWDSVAEAFDRD